VFRLGVMCGEEKVNQFLSTTQSWAFLKPEWVVQVQRWSPIVSSWNFLQPEATR
jgi:hypothetical protein